MRIREERVGYFIQTTRQGHRRHGIGESPTAAAAKIYKTRLTTQGSSQEIQMVITFN